MRKIIRFKNHFNVETVSDDGVYLLSELPGGIRLPGQLMLQLAPLLGGKHDRQQVVATLAGEIEPARVERALDRLLESGHVVEAAADADPRASGYWEMLGLDADAVSGALSGRRLELVTFGDVHDESFTAAAESFGLTVADPGVDAGDPDLTVVLVDDYLNANLAEFNRKQLAEGRSWLLAKPIGSVVWVGPVFEPSSTACWECLANRISGNQMIATYLRQRTGADSAPVTSLADLPASRRLATELIAMHAAKWFAAASSKQHRANDSFPGSEQLLDSGDVFTLSTLNLHSQRHLLRRRPQCPACGDAELQARLHQKPLALTSRPKADITDGGHRAKKPEALLAEFEPQISPITGPVKQLTKMPGSVDGLHTYHAGQNFAVPMPRIGDLRAGLRSAACGKGITETQAKASAVAEAIERYSGLHRGDEARITASLDELGKSGIAPNELALYSDRQFAERDWWNAKDYHFQRVCHPFDPSQSIEWTPIWSLTSQQPRYLPTASLFYGYPVQPGNVYAGADSNGNAAGTSVEDAIVQGFMELVERDSVALWWYNKLRRPSIDLTSFDEPYFSRWQELYRSVNRETWVLDLTSDLGIPAVAAVSHRVDKPVEDLLIAFGAHFDVKIAISRAMTEMNQFLPSVVHVGPDSDDYRFPDPQQQEWWRTATLANQPYLVPAADRQRTAADYTDLSTDDLAEDVRVAQRVVGNAGLEMFVLDQTRPDIGLPVVKVIVPGMRHFWTRFAPGRLYDVPVRMGWLAEPTPESDLNPIGMFL
jgi:oxazoline/thiazoline synthase